MSRGRSAAATVVVIGGCVVIVWAYERWPNATLGSLAALATYRKFREMEAPGKT